jgi:hypothetical protein
MKPTLTFLDSLSPADQVSYRTLQRDLNRFVIDQVYDHASLKEKDILDFLTKFPAPEILKLKSAISIQEWIKVVAKCKHAGMPKWDMIKTHIQGLQQWDDHMNTPTEKP